METKNITNIWSRIFFEGEKIQYEVFLENEKGASILYNIYSSFKEYRAVISELSHSKEHSSYISI